MGKLIRLTVTTTTTETWTLVWLPAVEPLSQPATGLHNIPNPKEKPDETLPATLTAATDQPNASNSTAPPTGVSTRSTAGRRRKRAPSRRAADNQQSKQDESYSKGE